MAEAWDELGLSRRQKALLAKDAEKIKATCAEEHKTKHIVQCADCYGRLLDRMCNRYLDSSDPEWFSDRRSFLQELEGMFADVKAHKADLGSIETRISEEKKRWYMQRIQDSPAIRRITDEVMGKETLLDRVNDRTVTFEALVEEIRNALHEGSHNSLPNSDEALGRLTPAQTPSDREQTYKDILFAEVPGQQKYADMLQSGIPIDAVMYRIIGDKNASLEALDRKEKHMRRLDELRRARTAHELQKTKKTKDRQSSAQVPDRPAYLADLPGCAVCGTIPDRGNILSCTACLVMADRQVREDITVYCSDGCRELDLPKHFQRHHPCASLEHCIQVVDEDVEMDENYQPLSLCSECLNIHKLPSMFCSPRCADANFQRHREEVHLPQRERDNAPVDDEDKLAHEGENKTRYHAKNISDHINPLEDLLREWWERYSKINIVPA